jgi:hypothetical protein
MALCFLVALQNSISAFQAALSSKIEAANLYTIEDGKWIVESAALISKEFADSLGVVALESSFIVVPVTGYFGRAQPRSMGVAGSKNRSKNCSKIACRGLPCA